MIFILEQLIWDYHIKFANIKICLLETEECLNDIFSYSLWKTLSLFIRSVSEIPEGKKCNPVKIQEI